MTLSSMTGFAREAGTLPDGSPFAWELKSVNGRGLDLRFRLPPGLDALEAAAREAAAKSLKRGNVQVGLALTRERRAALQPDPAALERALALALDLAARIPGCPPPRAEALLALPGVMRPEAEEASDDAAQRAALLAAFGRALAALLASRRAEGARLQAALSTLLDEIETLSAAALAEAGAQPEAQQARLTETLDRLLGEEARARFPEERLAQEVALLASKSDIREELDRLAAHLAARATCCATARARAASSISSVQEFVREVNTLCAKSASVGLTRLGLELKAAIERLREQAANVE
jgi:uncharacterized protein (TIGR00255 family)